MKTKIACVQMQSALGKKRENLEKMKEKIRLIMEDKEVSIIVFPELAVTGYECGEQYEELAESFPEGESIQELAQAAAEFNVFLAFGFVEKAEKDGRQVLYNSVALIDNKGNALGQYRKSHLVEGPETQQFEKGTESKVFDTEIGKIGIMICWDSAYPEVARILALKGAEIILCPAAWEAPYDEDWDIVQCARSFDNVLYVASCNHVGTDRELTFFGKSKITGPVGRTIVEAGDQEEVIKATVDLGALPALREGFYVLLKDRNPQTYGDIVADRREA